MDAALPPRSKRVVWVVLLAVALPLLAPTLMGTAQACSCGPRGAVEDDIAAHEWVFVGRQIGRGEVADGTWRVILEIEVVDVYKGEVPPFVELRTGFGSGDCGVDFFDGREVGFTVDPDEDGPVVSSCGGAHRADAIRLQFEPPPIGTGTGPPGFLVGTTVGPVRVAVLDDTGVLLRYAHGEGRLAAAAVCPGGRTIVEVTDPLPTAGDARELRPRLEIRDVASLEIEQTAVLDMEIADMRPLNGFPWILDLACHAADGRSVSFLLPTGVWDPQGAAPLPGPATLMTWDGTGFETLDAGTSRTTAVDVRRGVFYSVTGIDGRTLETRDLDGNLIESTELPGQHVAWRMVLSDDGSRLVMLARFRPMGRDNWYFAEVNRILTLDLVDGSTSSHRLPGRGFATSLAKVDDGYHIAVSSFEENVTELSRFDGDGVTLLAEVADADTFMQPAIGRRVALLGLHEQSVYEAIDLATGEALPIDGLVRSRIAIALPAGLDVEVPDVTTTTAPTPPTTSAVLPTGPPEGTTTTSVVAGPVDDAAPGSLGWFLLVGALAAAGVVVLMRRMNSGR